MMNSVSKEFIIQTLNSESMTVLHKSGDIHTTENRYFIPIRNHKCTVYYIMNIYWSTPRVCIYTSQTTPHIWGLIISANSLSWLLKKVLKLNIMGFFFPKWLHWRLQYIVTIDVLVDVFPLDALKRYHLNHGNTTVTNHLRHLCHRIVCYIWSQCSWLNWFWRHPVQKLVCLSFVSHQQAQKRVLLDASRDGTLWLRSNQRHFWSRV